MFEHYIKSINKTIQYEDAIQEENLEGVNLGDLTEEELSDLYMESVGYAETLISFEIESRGRHD